LNVLRSTIHALCDVIFATASALVFLLYSATAPAEDLHSIERQVHQIVNQVRNSNHLPELTWNEQLAAEARRHALRIASGRFFAHQDPLRGDIDRRLNKSGIEWMRCAENLYEGEAGNLANEAVRAWLKSEGHRKNMLDSLFSDTGVGIAIKRDKTIVIVQEYIFR
jgi:uncharacterized protein YkwD